MRYETKINANNLKLRPQEIKDSYLFTAIETNDYEEVQKALNAGASVESREKGDTPLHAAIRVKSPEIIELLLEYGADKQIENNEGESAESLAQRDCEECEETIRNYFSTDENVARRAEAKRRNLALQREEIERMLAAPPSEKQQENNARRRTAARAEIERNLRPLKDELERAEQAYETRPSQALLNKLSRLKTLYHEKARTIYQKSRVSGGKRKTRKTKKSGKKTRKGKRRM